MIFVKSEAIYTFRCPKCNCVDELEDTDFYWENDSEVCEWTCINCESELKILKPY